jgi:hypothetical protein
VSVSDKEQGAGAPCGVRLLVTLVFRGQTKRLVRFSPRSGRMWRAGMCRCAGY